MKKVKNLSIACIMVALIMAALIPAKAADINDSLVCWWNFEGETLEERLADKASAGSSKDNLEVLTDESGSGVVFNNGIVYIDHAEGNILQLVDVTEDTRDFSQVTIYMHFKPTGIATQTSDVFYNKETVRTFVNDGCTDGLMSFTTRINNSAAKKAVFSPEASRSGDSNGWFYMAITVSYNSTAKTAEVVNYLSTDGQNYVKQSTTVVDVDPMERVNPIYIGKTGSTYDRGISVYYNDIRIYNCVLTEQEVATIASTTPATTTNSSATTTTSGTTAPQTGNIEVVGISALTVAASAVTLVIFRNKRKRELYM